MMKYSDQLTELQKLSHRLLEVNSIDTMEYLEQAMRDLQEQWDLFEEKFVLICTIDTSNLIKLHLPPGF